MWDGGADALDAMLVGVGARDRAAFRALHDAAGAKLFGVALRICRERTAAEEAWQEAMLAIWTHAVDYTPERGAALAWMIAITRRRAIDVLRRRGRAPVAVEPGALEAMIEAARVAEPEAPDREALLACLDGLEAGAREMVLLAYVEGWSREELAARADAPVNTIKTRLRRALLSLRACIEGEGR